MVDFGGFALPKKKQYLDSPKFDLFLTIRRNKVLEKVFYPWGYNGTLPERVNIEHDEIREEFNKKFYLPEFLKKYGIKNSVDAKLYLINEQDYGLFDSYIFSFNGEIYNFPFGWVEEAKEHCLQLPNGRVLEDAFAWYTFYLCNGSIEQAKNWKNDPVLFRFQQPQPQQFQTPIQAPPSTVELPVNHLNQPNQMTSVPAYCPPPMVDIDEELNPTAIDNYANLTKGIPDNHILKRMASFLGKKHNIHENIVFLGGLVIASGAVSRKYKVAFKKTSVQSNSLTLDEVKELSTIPPVLYGIAEKTAGGGKTPVLNALLKPMTDIFKSYVEKMEKIVEIDQENLDALEDREYEMPAKEFKIQKKRLKKKLDISTHKLVAAKAIMPKTNCTISALEESLNYTKGYFSAISDEQSLIDVLICANKKKSNEILLRGINAENVDVIRVSRKGFQGDVIGNFFCFAQSGSIEKVLNSSGTSGLRERFLYIVMNVIKLRNYKDFVPDDDELLEEYAEKFNFLKALVEKPLAISELVTLQLTDRAWYSINDFNNYLEPSKYGGAAFSSELLKVMADKITSQIMSVATILYVFDAKQGELPVTQGNHFIPDEYVHMAIQFNHEHLISFRAYCLEEGFITTNEMKKVMMSYFDAGESVKEDLLIHNCAQRVAFKNSKSYKRMAAKNTLDLLLHQNVLIRSGNMISRNQQQVLSMQNGFLGVNRWIV